MDASQFDRWTRAISTRSGRRALLRRAVGATAALGSIGTIAERTAAKKKCDKSQKKKCFRQGLVCEKGKCVLPCNARTSQCLDTSRVVLICGDLQDGCSCSRLAEGGFTCAARLDDPDQNCPGASECERNSDCAAGEVCVDAASEHCCGSPGFGICLRKCKI